MHSGSGGAADQPAALPHVDAAGRPTLKTVAELAGVHPSTASRALSPHQVGVRVASEATIENVRKVAHRIGFERNPWAASLRRGRNDTIGVLVPRLSDLVLATIYEGIESAAGARGVLALVTNTHDDEQDRARRADLLLRRRVDGLILGDARLQDDALLTTLRQRNVPFVLVSRRSEGCLSVTCDDVAGGALAAEHLIANGHRNLAIIAGASYASTGVDRTSGFVEAARSAGVLIPPNRIVQSGFDAEAGHITAAGLLASSQPPTAIFAVNDFAAIGAMGAIREAGLSPGVDVAVVGYNDVSIARELPIPLTSVSSPRREMGSQSVNLLLDLILGKNATSQTLAPTLSVRASSSHLR